MNLRSRRLPVLVTLASALVLAATASAGPIATKQRIEIETSHGSFVFSPLKVGVLRRDTGTHGCSGTEKEGEVFRDGQQAFTHDCSAWTFRGKQGSLVIHNQFAWVAGPKQFSVATGSWKLVHGTGQYKGVTGHGRSVHIATASTWNAHYEGTLTMP
jgi:hypothetical protein